MMFNTNSAASSVEESTATIAAMVEIVRLETAASAEDSSADTTKSRCELNVQLSVAPMQDETISLVQKEAPATMTRKRTWWWQKVIRGISLPSRRKMFKKSTSARSEQVATSYIATPAEESRQDSMAEQFEHVGQVRLMTNANDDLPATGTSPGENAEADSFDEPDAELENDSSKWIAEPAEPKQWTGIFRRLNDECDWWMDQLTYTSIQLIVMYSNRRNPEADRCGEPYAEAADGCCNSDAELVDGLYEPLFKPFDQYDPNDFKPPGGRKEDWNVESIDSSSTDDLMDSFAAKVEEYYNLESKCKSERDAESAEPKRSTGIFHRLKDEYDWWEFQLINTGYELNIRYYLHRNPDADRCGKPYAEAADGCCNSDAELVDGLFKPLFESFDQYDPNDFKPPGGRKEDWDVESIHSSGYYIADSADEHSFSNLMRRTPSPDDSMEVFATDLEEYDNWKSDWDTESAESKRGTRIFRRLQNIYYWLMTKCSHWWNSDAVNLSESDAEIFLNYYELQSHEAKKLNERKIRINEFWKCFEGNKFATEDFESPDGRNSLYESDALLLMDPMKNETISLVQKEVPATMTRKRTRWWQKVIRGMSLPSRRKAFKTSTSTRSEQMATSYNAAPAEEESMAEQFEADSFDEPDAELAKMIQHKLKFHRLMIALNCDIQPEIF